MAPKIRRQSLVPTKLVHRNIIFEDLDKKILRKSFRVCADYVTTHQGKSNAMMEVTMPVALSAYFAADGSAARLGATISFAGRMRR